MAFGLDMGPESVVNIKVIGVGGGGNNRHTQRHHHQQFFQHFIILSTNIHTIEQKDFPRNTIFNHPTDKILTNIFFEL